MKTRRIVLIFSLILCLGMLVACNADVAEQNAGDKLAYATFKNDAKEFSVSYDGYKSFDDLFWYYKADKLDAYGQTGDTGDYYAKVPGNTQTGKGLDGKTEALSEGKWQFTLMAFESALSETATGSKRYDAEHVTTQSAIYSGSTPGASEEGIIVIRRNQTNYIPVTVTPVAGTGHIKFENAYYVWEAAGSVSKPNVKITITMPVTSGQTVTNYVITKELTYSTTAANYPISGYIWLKNDAATGTIDDSTSVEGYTNDIPAGVYAASIVITPVNDEDNIIFADQNLSLKVFGGLTATITGSLKELLSYENYFAVPEVDVKVFNPTTTSETVITSDYVAKDEKASGDTTKVTFPANALTSTNQHSLEIEVFSAAVSESKFVATTTNSRAVAGLDLTLTKVTRTSEGDVKEETVTEFANSEYATIVTYINPGLEDVAVKYNGTDKAQPIATDDTTAEDRSVAAILNDDEQAAGKLGYNPATGYLSFKTNHFSEYYVQAKVYVQNVTTGKYYRSLRDAVDDAQDGQTIKLLRDISLGAELEIAKSITLDFGGYNITAINHEAIWVSEGIVTLSGSGTISANKDDNKPGATTFKSSADVIYVGSSSGGTIAGLVIGSNVVVSSNHCYGVVVCGKETQGQELVVYGKVTVTGIKAAISGNGSLGFSKTTITINEGAVVSSTGVDTDNGAGPVAIYHPQGGTLTVNGGTITGSGTGIEAEAGSVVIKGGEIKTTYSGDAGVKSGTGDGPVTYGYSVVAVKRNYPYGPANVSITGGTITGAVGVESFNGGTDDAVLAITGGTFDSDPSFYCAPGYVAIENPEGTWTVEFAYDSGTGTSEDPFIIKDAKHVESFYSEIANERTNGVYYKLANDLAITGGSASAPTESQIGKASYQLVGGKDFEGHFDGNNKKIYFSYAGASTTTVSLFGNIKNASIKDLEVVCDINNNSGNWVAAVCMFAPNSSFSNVTVSGTITNNDDISGFCYAPGDGENNTTFSDCSVTATLTNIDGRDEQNYVHIGLLAAQCLKNVTFNKCSYNGTVNVNKVSKDTVAPFIGFIATDDNLSGNTVVLTDCTVDFTINNEFGSNNVYSNQYVYWTENLNELFKFYGYGKGGGTITVNGSSFTTAMHKTNYVWPTQQF